MQHVGLKSDTNAGEQPFTALGSADLEPVLRSSDQLIRELY
jgi:hypothetical protein